MDSVKYTFAAKITAKVVKKNWITTREQEKNLKSDTKWIRPGREGIQSDYVERTIIPDEDGNG